MAEPLVSLHVQQQGAGAVVVFCHGFGGSSRNFNPQVRALRDGYRVVAFDARGHARSAAPSEPEQYARELFIEDLARIVDEATSESVVVCGLSMGASLALDYAREHERRVAGLVLAAFPPGGPASAAWANAFADAIERDGLDAAGARFVWGGDRFDSKGAALIRQGFLEHRPHAIQHTLRSVIATEPSFEERLPALRDLDVPTLIVVGDNDAPSIAPSIAFAEALPVATLLRVPGAGHVVNLEKAQIFSDATRDFLGRIEHVGGASSA